MKGRRCTGYDVHPPVFILGQEAGSLDTARNTKLLIYGIDDLGGSPIAHADAKRYFLRIETLCDQPKAFPIALR